MSLPLLAVPRSWFTGSYDVTRAGERLAVLDVAWFRYRGRFELEGRRFELDRESLLGDFRLLADGQVLCRARKTSAFRRAFEVRLGQFECTFQAASPFRQTFVLRKGDARIGEVRPRHAFSRKAEIDLPDDLPLEFRLFLLWLVVLLWRHQAAAASGG
jgi:hypothetical protein